MNLNAFSHLPDDARLWLFVLDRPLEGVSRTRFEASLAEALRGWQHKGTRYDAAAFTLAEGQVLLVAEPTMAVNPSGCAIEGLNRRVEHRVAEASAALVAEGPVVVKGAHGLVPVDRESLEQAVSEGRLEAGTPILDRTLFNLGDLRRRGLFQPAATTWLGRKFGWLVLAN